MWVVTGAILDFESQLHKRLNSDRLGSDRKLRCLFLIKQSHISFKTIFSKYHTINLICPIL